MSLRLAWYAVVPLVLVAVGWWLSGAERAPDATVAPVAVSPAPAATREMPLSGAGPSLPPNHPPIGASSPHASPLLAPDDPPALTWTMPDGWREAPSPSAMRLATYRVPGGVEVSISRAGGATEANIQRWTSQFDDVGHEERAERTVRGLHVVMVDVAGTFVGGGVTMGGPAEPERNWALVGAIVETRGSPYFFKMTGPAAAVRAARRVFDHLVASLAPT